MKGPQVNIIPRLSVIPADHGPFSDPYVRVVMLPSIHIEHGSTLPNAHAGAIPLR